MNTPALHMSVLKLMNVVLTLIVVMLLSLAAFIADWRPVMGISIRLVIAVLCFTNSLWLFVRRKSFFQGGLLLIVGIGLVVTSLWGYSFNGQALLGSLFQ